MGSNISTLIIQDDMWSGSLHLDEVILSAIPTADKGAAAFAFATRDGLSAVFGSEEFREFCRKGSHFDLYIGIDSITDDRALQFAKEIASDLNGMLNVKVYYNPDKSAIFHPKTTWFRHEGGDGGVTFSGSGNLTKSGLQKNVEMFSWIEQDKQAFDETTKTWYGWIEAISDSGLIHDVDDELVLERAKQNKWNRVADENLTAGVGNGPADDTTFVAVRGDDAVLISQMPKQTGRGWGQFAMAKSFFGDYFGFDIPEKGDKQEIESKRRVLLQSVDDEGNIGVLESRAGNISVESSNYRIELGAGHNYNASDTGAHIVSFVKVGAREYLYHICDSSSDWFDGLLSFAGEHMPENMKGNPKCLVSASLFTSKFPQHPLSEALRGQKSQ